MTNRRQETEQAKGALFFTTVLTIAAGAAGLAFAGTVVGLAYMLKGEPDERDRLAEQRAEERRARYEDALAWLEDDRAHRARVRAARREWFEADPKTRGDAPPSGDSFGRVAARAWYSTRVRLVRFGRGWRDGREEAQLRREAGESGWWRPRHQPNRSDASDPNPETKASEPPPEPVEPLAKPATKPQRPARDDIIDAEIVPDSEEPQSTNRDVVLVGGDDAKPDLNIDGYAARIDALRDEVDQTRGSRSDDPSLPSTLR